MQALLVAFLLASSACYVSAKAVPAPFDDDEIISCEFFGSGAVEDEYGCALTLRNPNGIEFESIQGAHNEGFDDSDVFVVVAFAQDSPIVPAVICRQFPNLDTLVMSSGNLRELTPAAFADCGNLRQIIMQGNELATIPANVFAASANLAIADFSANQLTEVSADAFSSTSLEFLELAWNRISEVQADWFNQIASTLVFLDLMGNEISTIGDGVFSPLTNLMQLFLDFNQIDSIAASAFNGLTSLESLSLSYTTITELIPEWFSTLTSLRVFAATNNRIASLPDDVFTPLTNLQEVFLYQNRIRDITAAAFGASAANLRTLYINNNMINNIDPFWLDSAAQLEYLLLSNNLCANRDFLNVGEIRWRIFEELNQCIDNFMLDPWIQCNYMTLAGGEYACTMYTHNPNSINDFTEIEGQHLAGFGNEDLVTLSGIWQNTRIIPSIICESFPNLRNLLFLSSNIEDLTEDSFGGCAHLEILTLHNNRINAIPDFTFRNNPELRLLDAGMNWIETLSENSFTGSAIVNLDVDSNRLTEFRQEWFTSINETLLTLDVVGNNFESLQEDAFSNLRGLTFLVLGNNPLTTIPGNAFQSLTNLQVLTLDRTGLTALNPEWFLTLTSLTQLFVQNNQLRELPDNVFDPLESLLAFTINDNQLMELSGAAFGRSLSTIFNIGAQRNNMRSFDPSIIEDATNLNFLFLSGNICNGDDFNNVQANRDFVSERLAGCFSNFGTEAISCRFSSYAEDESDYVCSMTVNNPLGRNNFASIEGEHLPGRGDADVQTIYVFFGLTLNIPEVICRQFPNLVEMDFMSDAIEFLEVDSFSGCAQLQTLMIFNNLITEIPANIFANNPSLSHVILGQNRLTTIPGDVFAGTSLTFLDLSNNPLENFNTNWVEPARSTLTSLDLWNIGITWMPFNAFDGLTALEVLTIGGNPLSEMPASVFASLGNLLDLNMGSCRFRNINPAWYQPLVNLETLHVQSNRILDLPANAFNALTSLQTLYAYNNNLRELNVDSFGSAALSSVRTLFTSFNEIISIEPNFVNAATSLEILYLNNNECTQENFYLDEIDREQVNEMLSDCFSNFAAEQIRCNYAMNADNNYGCMMEIFNPVGRDGWTEIEGTHLAGMNDANVVQVAMLFQNTRIVPNIICSQFPNLRELIIFSSQLDVLSERSFAQCSELRDLILFDNTLVEIPDFVFVGSPNLRLLELGLNRLERLSDNSLAGTAIEFLDISSNYLSSYEPSWFAPINSTLHTLDLLNNNIRFVPPDAFRELRDLRQLVLNSNPIGFLPGNIFEALDSLEELYLANCSLPLLNQQWFRPLRSLRHLQLNHNGITFLPNDVFAQLRQLHTLELAENFIWEITSQQFGDSLETIEVVDLRENIVNIIDGSWLTSATSLDFLLMTGNVCRDQNFSNVAGFVWVVLEYLYDCTANFVLEPEISCEYQTGAFYTCNLQAHNPRGFDQFTNVPGDHLAGMTDASVIGVVAMAQEMRNFPQILCMQFENLEDIFVFQSNLLDVGIGSFLHCTRLQFLAIDGNLIRHLPNLLLSNSPQLQFVSFAGNRITNVDNMAFAGTVIDFVDLGFNRIENFNPVPYRVIDSTLQTLDLIGNRIRGFPMGAFDDNTNLRQLVLDRNPLTELYAGTFAALSNLELLSLAHCQLGQLNPVLTYNLINVRQLNLQDNELDNLPDGMFHNMSNLATLNIYENRIRHLSAVQFGGAQESIQIIRATSNELNSIDPDLIDNASQLEYLLVSDNFCVDNDFLGVQNNLEEVREGLATCFDNFVREPSMLCRFDMTELDEYACDLEIHNPDGLSTGVFDDVPGEHLAGRGDDDVLLVAMISQNSRNFPSILCRTFPNVHEILAMFSNMEIITATTFRSCENLEVLFMNGNRLTTIPADSFVNSPRLHTLGLGSNRLANLNVNSFAGTAISMLDLADNRLETFSIGWLQPINETLTILELEANQISGVGSDAFRNLRNLETLALSNNNLAIIAGDAFISLGGLRILALGNGNIREVNPAWFAPLASLERLYLFGNAISELPGGAFNGLVSLDNLELDDNELTSIGVNALGASLATLTGLHVRNNQIDAVDERILDNAVNLNWLTMENNVCASENFNDVRERQSEVRDSLRGCFDNFLNEARMRCNYQVTMLDEYACILDIHNPEGLSTGVFDDVPGDHLDGRGDSDVQIVSMAFQNSRNFPSIICRTFPNVHEILIMWSHVDTITASTFANCANLEVLYLNSNELTTIPANALSNSPRLHTLALGSNRIAELNANSFAGTAISFLDLADNQFASINPAWFGPIESTLTVLDVVANALTAIDDATFANLQSLEVLNLNINGITALSANAFASLTNLRTLALGNNSLSTVNPAWFASTTGLTRLYLFANGIASLPNNVFNSLTSLDYLELDDNALTSFGLAPLGNAVNTLHTLMLRHNAINAIDPLLVDSAANLDSLFLEGNVCVSENFINVRERLWEIDERLQECFANA